jgi:hypothetical protein
MMVPTLTAVSPTTSQKWLSTWLQNSPTNRDKDGANVPALELSASTNKETVHMETIDGRTMCNGIDITDKVKKYPPQKWTALPYSFRQEIMDAKQMEMAVGRVEDVEGEDVAAEGALSAW